METADAKALAAKSSEQEHELCDTTFAKHCAGENHQRTSEQTSAAPLHTKWRKYSHGECQSSEHHEHARRVRNDVRDRQHDAEGTDADDSEKGTERETNLRGNDESRSGVERTADGDVEQKQKNKSLTQAALGAKADGLAERAPSVRKPL
ncbi:hypothetical protein R1flu_023502 [Riccia fluitans]|uniref:Uncharacterized protein n=1 Tax=Riccia fluitans TaxID=41844 RepID=A0ABD1XS70_9MARC